jgi:NIPSNAP
MHRKFLALVVCICAFAPLSNALAEPIQQLRIYEIFENNKQAFHERFRDHAMRIMKKYDFKILAMWEAKTNERTEFVYLLEWPDEATLKDRWAKFLADKEWIEIKKQTAAKYGQLVGKVEARTLIPTAYSPKLVEGTSSAGPRGLPRDSADPENRLAAP